MSGFERITSFQNPKIKQLRKLRERRERDRQQRFVIDDSRDLERALECGYEIDYGLYCAELDQGGGAIPDPIADGSIFEVPRAIMEKASYRQNPSPVVVVMKQPAPPGLDALRLRIVSSDKVSILVLVDLRKPGNIGALLRTADAAGFTTILLVDTALDIYNPNVIRSSTGACFLGNIYTASTAEALRLLREGECSIIAAAVTGDCSLFDVDFPSKFAIVLGTEDRGLDDTWLNAADRLVRIPMSGKLSDSLNVSVSGAIFMYQALRQRQSGR
jgi:RNA methyltransferase, TrmH family